MTENKRFTETLSTGIVIDNVTGKEYKCEMRIDDDLLKLLNELYEELKPIQEVCDKYNIPIKDLPEILEEYIAYDNDDNW